MTSPVIIINAPHSGASLVSQILHHAGIFMGEDLEENFASAHFTRLNCWLFAQAGATWDNPHNFNFVDRHFTDETRRVLKRQLKGRYIKKYMGQLHRRTHSYKRIDFDWGWYAPMNAFGFDVWKHLIKNYTLIHVLRNPVDVAASLQKAADDPSQHRSALTLSGWKRRFREKKLDMQRLYSPSVRVRNLYEGFELWQQYIGQIQKIEQAIPGASFLTIRYESLLQQPETTIRNLFDYLDFKLPDGIIDTSVERIRSGRAFAFSESKKLMEFYQTIKNHSLVTELNYHNLD